MRARNINSLDAHKQIKAFQKVGIDEQQAELLVEYVSKSREYDLSKLASKDDLKLVTNELTSKMDALDNKIITQIEIAKNEMLKWVIALLVSIIVTGFGIILTMIFK